MKRRAFLTGLITVLIGCLFILAACKDPSGDSDGEGSFTISLGNASGTRAAAYPPDWPADSNPGNPTIDQFWFELIFTPVSGGNGVKQFDFDGVLFLSSSAMSGSVPVGFYTVEMKAYEKPYEDNILYARGSAVSSPVEIKSGINATIKIELGDANKASMPMIGTQPVGESYTQNAPATALTIAASVTDGGALTYQWYRTNALSNTDLTDLTNVISQGPSISTPDFTPSTTTAGTFYYFVVVTNTRGATTATATSTVVTVTVTAPSGSSGDALWARTIIAGTASASFNAVAVAPNGDVYAAGRQAGNASYTYGNGVSINGFSNNSNPILVRYDSAGNATRAITVIAGPGSGVEAIFNSVAVATDGSVYVAGRQDGSATFNYGTGNLSVFNNNNPILVRYDSAGNAEWVRTTVTASGGARFLSVAISPLDGSVYAAGYQLLDGIFDYGNGTTAAGANATGNNPVLVKYDQFGDAQWAMTTITGVIAEFNSVAVCPIDGSVYAAGRQVGTGIFDYGNGQTATGVHTVENAVLVKYDQHGTTQWARTITAGTGNAQFYAVAVAADGSVYAAGRQIGTGTFEYGIGTTATGASANNNPVLVKYDSTGDAIWARTIIPPGTGSALFYSVAVAPNGDVYTAGNQGTGTFNYGNGDITVASSDSLVLVKYNSTGDAQWARTTSEDDAPSNIASFNGVAIGATSDNGVYAVGSQNIAGRDYTYGVGVIIAGTAAANPMLVKYQR